MKRLISILLLTVVLGSPGISGATTWRVEQDGSGDWMTIQAGVQAAADGDTVLIGAGRWSNLFPIWSGSEGVVYWTDAKELYLIGAGTDSTFIGPEEYTQLSVYSVGLAYDGPSAQHIRDLSFVNMDYGLMTGGDGVQVANCAFVDCEFAASIYYADSGLISDCAFSRYRSISGANGLMLMGTQGVVVENCSFHDMGVYHDSSSRSSVLHCIFDNFNEDVAISYANAGGGVFEGNEVLGGTVFASLSGHIEIRDNEFSYNSKYGANIIISDHWADVEMHRNVFHGGAYAAIGLAGASLAGSDNHILCSVGAAVKLTGYNGTFVTSIDLRNNYWGISDADSIAAMIWDGNDDPTIQQTVQFEPFSTIPLSTEEQSLDSFKSMFR